MRVFPLSHCVKHPALGLLQRIRGEKLTEEPGGPVLRVVRRHTCVWVGGRGEFMWVCAHVNHSSSPGTASASMRGLALRGTLSHTHNCPQTYTLGHTCTNTDMHTQGQTHTDMYLHIQTCAYTQMLAHMYTQTLRYVHGGSSSCVHIYPQCPCTGTRVPWILPLFSLCSFSTSC